MSIVAPVVKMTGSSAGHYETIVATAQGGSKIHPAITWSPVRIDLSEVNRFYRIDFVRVMLIQRLAWILNILSAHTDIVID